MKISTILFIISLAAAAPTLLTKRDCDNDFDKCMKPYLDLEFGEEYLKAYGGCATAIYYRPQCRTDGSTGGLCVSIVLSVVWRDLVIGMSIDHW